MSIIWYIWHLIYLKLQQLPRQVDNQFVAATCTLLQQLKLNCDTYEQECVSLNMGISELTNEPIHTMEDINTK